MEEENEILEKLINGDRQAFDELFRKYHQYLVSIAYRFTENIDISRNLSKDVLLDIWEKRESIKVTSSIKDQIRQAIIDKSIAYIKESNYYSDIAEGEIVIPKLQKGAKSLDYIEFTKKIAELVKTLPDRNREMFQSSNYENKSHNEISEELGISHEKIVEYMTAALKQIRTGLKQSGLTF